MATTLAPVDSREVLRCDHCHLVQFRTANNLCRKCRLCLDREEPEPEPVPEPLSMEDLGEALFAKGLSNNAVEQVLTAIRRQRRLLRWYDVTPACAPGLSTRTSAARSRSSFPR